MKADAGGGVSGRLREEAAGFANALLLLTRLPVPARVFTARRMGRSVAYYPLVGALVGLAGAAVLLAAGLLLPAPVAVVVALATPVLLTGGLHEDGLADSFDSLAAVGDPERRRAILKDSGLGVFGMLALVFVLALAWTALVAVPPAAGAAALVAAHALGRWASAAVLWRVPYASGPGGSGTDVARGAGGGRVGFATLLAVLVAGVALGGAAVGAVAVAGLVAVAVGAHWKRTFGGVTGDGLGAASKLAETGVYGAVAAFYEMTGGL